MAENVEKEVASKGAPKGCKHKVERRLSNVEFFKACEMMRNEVEWFKTHRPTYVEAAAYMAGKLGFELAPQSVPQMVEATGVTWEKRSAGPNASSTVKSGSNGVRIVCNAQMILFRKLDELCRALGQPGVEPPITLTALHEYYKKVRTGKAEQRIGDIAELEDTTQMLAEAATQAQQASNGRTVTTPSATDDAGNVGIVVFKAGDEVVLDGSPFKRHKITLIRANGRHAVLDGNHEVRVDRLKPAPKR